MKVGDYVRTKSGGIGKIIEIENDASCSHIITDNETFGLGWDGEQVNWDFITEIVKSSPNIIDLIEVGDYVNGFRVNDSSYGLIIIAPTTDIWEMNSTKDEFKNNNLFVEKIYKLEDIEIKSVITKEQFESMEYKVGE